MMYLFVLTCLSYILRVCFFQKSMFTRISQVSDDILKKLWEFHVFGVGHIMEVVANMTSQVEISRPGRRFLQSHRKLPDGDSPNRVFST